MTREDLIEKMAADIFDTSIMSDAGQSAARAALSAIDKAGFAVVPKEPTEDMIRYGVGWREKDPDDRLISPQAQMVFAIYACMLSASPLMGEGE